MRRQQTRAVARSITLIESRSPARRQIIERLYPLVGRARIIGITGPPGAGKSTFVDRLARRIRARDETVGILAVDPTSPFSGGAILGDRIRMQELYTDPGVFIRSMATRGAMGGLAPATHDAVDLLDAAGFDWVLVETVGVGQDEVDIVRSVETVLVVTVPGMGDDIQAIKAGIMEIADIFLINKADRQGVDKTFRDLHTMVAMTEDDRRLPPILKTVAARGEGIEEVLEAIDEHRRWLRESGELEKRRLTHLRLRVENILKEKILDSADQIVGVGRSVAAALAAGTDPYRVAENLFQGVVERGSGAEKEGDR